MTRHTISSLTLLAGSLLALFTLFTACQTSEQEIGLVTTETDMRRDRALALFVGRKSTDAVNHSNDDSVDWKYIDINQSGELKLIVSVDEPRKLRGVLALRDNFSNLIERQEITADRSVYSFEPVQATPGRYFLQVESYSGSSVYTVGTSFKPVRVVAKATTSSSFSRVTEEDTPKTNTTTKRVVNTTARPKTTNNPSTNSTDTKQPGEETTDPPKPEPTFATVNGYVIRVTPLEEGGALLSINLSGEHSDKVRAGSTGTLTKLGKPVTVRRANGRAATAFTKVDSEQVKGARDVVFQVKLD